MYAVATFLIVAVITLFFVQMLTGALIATGLPPRIASFQARSAFSGAGFTTTESENVVNHAVRRRLIGAAILVGTLGTPTLVVTIVAGLIAPGPGSTTLRTLTAVIGLLIVVVGLSSRPVRGRLERVGHAYARRRLIPALAGETDELLSIGQEFAVASVPLTAEPDQTFRSLRSLTEGLPGLIVLGVQRENEFVGEAPVDITLHEGDELVVYGRRESIEALSD